MARHLLCGSSWLRAGLFVSSPYRLRHLFMTLYKSKCSLFGEMVHASYYAQSLTVQQKQTKKQNTEGSKSSKPVVDNDALWYHQRTVVVWVQSYTGEQVVLTSVVTEAGVLLTLGSSQAPVNWQSDNQDSVEVDAHGITLPQQDRKTWYGTWYELSDTTLHLSSCKFDCQKYLQKCQLSGYKLY